MSENVRALRVGMIGIGVGGAEILPAMEAMDEIDLMAGADVNEVTRQRFGERYPKARVYASAEDLCRDPDVEAVWISSPNRFHAEHAIIAASHGKHVVVEKPMALTIDSARQMVRTAKDNNVKLLAGHTMSYSVPIRAMRRVINSGRLGKLRAINVFSYSDWMLRPRDANELDASQGGGVVYRQGPHQIDTVRVLGGGMVRSVRGTFGQWMPERPIPGFYTAYMEFEDGTPATIMFNGYGYFMTGELVPWAEGLVNSTLADPVGVRKAMRAGTRNEDADKQEQRIGGAIERGRVNVHVGPAQPYLPLDLGLVIVSCERGDIRHSPYGIYIYDDDGIHDIDLSRDAPGQRREELEELYGGVVRGEPIIHDGEWGMATLEVCLSIIESANTHQEIELRHQVPVREHDDPDLRFDYVDRPS